MTTSLSTSMKATSTVQFLPLQRINAKHLAEIQQAVAKVLQSGWYVNGKEVSNFEKNYSRFTGAEYCIGTGNGLDALKLIFKGLIEIGKLRKGDRILVPANSFVASALAIEEAGLRPVFIDVNEDTFNIDLTEIERAGSYQVRGILAVHLFGQLSISQALLDYAKTKNLVIVEDAAQSVGASYQSKTSGNIGEAAAVSFYPGKNLGAFGDAGAITTNNEKLAEACRSLANYGSSKKYHHDLKGVNSRLDELQAAILNVKLKYIALENQERVEIAKFYLRNIKNDLVTLPEVANFNSHVFHLFVIKTKHRKALQAHLASKGIETLIHYPICIHKQEAYKEYKSVSCPVSERLSQEILSLPVFPGMTAEETEKVVIAVNSFSL